MTNILLTLSYDGTDFCGWQRQDTPPGEKPVRTVQGELEGALCRMLRVPVAVQGSGRTDSGVHALGQAANFFSPVDTVPEENYVRALNDMLPGDVRVMSAKKVPEDFSSRFNATSRIYRYFFFTQKIIPASRTRYVWHLGYKPDVSILNQMAECLRGELDCASFSAAGDQSVSTFRYIDGARFYEETDDTLVFEIEANAFLWRMVRSIAGTLIQGEQKGYDAAWFKSVLESRNRSRTLFTAPACGLFLHQVRFDGVRRHV